MSEADFNFMNLNQSYFVNLDEIYSVIHVGEVDVGVDLTVLRRKTLLVIEAVLHHKQEIKKNEEDRFSVFSDFKLHACLVITQFFMLKRQAHFSFYIFEYFHYILAHNCDFSRLWIHMFLKTVQLFFFFHFTISITQQ